MSAEGKAKKFAIEAERHGWTSEIELIGDEAHIKCIREGEQLTLWWRENSMIETPKYTFGGVTISNRNAADAYRQLSAKPNFKRAYRRNARKSSPVEVEEIPILRQNLPFDLDESPKSEILKSIRGNRIAWLNSGTGLPEEAMVPYKLPGGKTGMRVFNVDLKNVFYIKPNKNGRRYVSFMDINGTFRAVYLDNILQVT